MSEAQSPISARVQLHNAVVYPADQPLEGSPAGEASALFEVTAITAGEGNGWNFTSECLRHSLPLWEGVEIFIDHQQGSGRSLRDLAGVGFAARFDETCAGIRLQVRPSGPSARLLATIGAEWLASAAPRPRVGFSADVVFSASEQTVMEILKVISLDLVYRPARGGRFNRLFNQEFSNQEEETYMNTHETPILTTPSEPEQHLQADLLHVKQALLALTLKESGLPEAAQSHVRTQFSGKPLFRMEELEEAVRQERELLASLQGASRIHSAGRVEGMFNERDRIQAAADDLLGAPREKSAGSLHVASLSGIRELYLHLTGDHDFHGKYARHAQLADSNSMANVLKNSFNKIMLRQWEELGRAGYRWWEKVVTVEHMNSLQPVSGILLGEVSALGVVDEGSGYGELEITDSGESQAFKKYGGLLPVTLEMIDKDETHKLRQLPNKLAASAVRNISSLVAGLFSGSSGVGPLMTDGLHVFEAGVHANLGTAALSAASFEAASQAIYHQGMPSTDTQKPHLAVDARYLLVPRALRLTAMRILYPSFERESNIFAENMQRGELGDVITVPDWTDANDWAAMADPRFAPGVIIAERFGLLPEIFVADNEQGFDMVHNDTINLKVRHFLAVFVADYRPLYKANVA
ncbi:MAG: hypothetical protein CVU39_21030 [Chloroflexi bacterium HGW-Chloroflexi-10]|nr:MAG: hypothetical protein CVU39_21030 [Chloroflexi bacterium HGW-Chloroflexi-10]